jgi:hypothetical protein
MYVPITNNPSRIMFVLVSLNKDITPYKKIYILKYNSIILTKNTLFDVYQQVWNTD